MVNYIVIVDERGKEISEPLLDKQHDLIALNHDLDHEQYPYLSCLDPYGDTYLNRLQIPLFLKELSTATSKNRKKNIFFDALRDIALHVQNNSGQFLKFLGD